MAPRALFHQLITVATLGVALPCPAQLLHPVDGPPATIEPTSAPAAGRHEAAISVARFGRYAITGSSEQGVSLQLVDRMAGPGPISGAAGERDGRLDVFLDRGQYKVLVDGHERASGEAVLAVRELVELQPSPAPQLEELKPVRTTLADLEQRSWWIQVDAPRWVALEAAGRHLSDLRLWRDGSWMVDAEPVSEVLEPEVGRPLMACRVNALLEPGLYLVTAYGGVGQPWADDSGERPLHLRWGLPRLGEAGRARHQVSPFGVDRYLVPALATYHRLELPEAVPARLQVAEFTEEAPWPRWGRQAAIDKESRQPVAEIETGGRRNGWLVVTVSARAGQPYTLQHFEERYEVRFRQGGDYWLSTVHSGHPQDSVDVTAILARWTPAGLDRLAYREQVVSLDSTGGWARRCNLLDDLQVFFHIAATGDFTVLSEGTEAVFRFEPFFVYRPSQYEPPPFRPAGATWSLDSGYYVLTARPVRKGIMDVAVKAAGVPDSLLELLGAATDVPPEPVLAAATFPEVALNPNHHYGLFLARQPGVRAGAILRQLPLDLTEPLPLTLRPGESPAIPFTATEASTVRATAEDGTALELSLDGGPWGTSARADRGGHTLTLRSAAEDTLVLSVAATPVRLEVDTPLPPLPDSTLAGLPRFEVLTEGQTTAFDLGRGHSATFLVEAPEDALFRLETTGLLDTSGTLRSRVVTSLASSSRGGSGRNFFLHQHLNQGDYQVTVGTRGASAGHLGLRLERTDPLDGGRLPHDVPVRITLDAGQSVAYTFAIDHAATYHLRTVGLGRGFACRLEDEDGWPIIRPGGLADIRRRFEPGVYRLVLLPEPVPGRRVTLLEEVPEPADREGHGPHHLPLDTAVEHLWLEPEGGGPRTPDAWSFRLPAACEVRISVSGEMEGVVLRADGPDGAAEAATIPPRTGWTGTLEGGEYRLELRCARQNNRVPYTLSVTPVPLVAGLSRRLKAPCEVALSVAGGMTEVASFGASDVRARLIGSDGEQVAANDDRQDDWNFHIARQLTAGTYTLLVEPVGAASAVTTVRLDVRDERLEEPVTVPGSRRLEPGDLVSVLPLNLPHEGGLLVASADAAEAVGLVLEQGAGSGWIPLASTAGSDARLEVPLESAGPWRLRVWSADRRGLPIDLAVSAPSPRRVREIELVRGLDLEPGGAMAAAMVELDRPGTLRLGREDVRWSQAPGEALRPARAGVLTAATGRLWLAVDAADGPARLQAARVRVGLEPRQLQIPVDGDRPAVVDLWSGEAGPTLAVARALVGRPAVAVGEAAARAGAPLDTGATVVVPGAAAALALAPSDPVARVWQGGPDGGPVDVRLEATSFPPPALEPAGWGTLAETVEAGECRAFALPSGPKALHITLPPGAAAATSDGTGVSSLHWGGDAPLFEVVEAEAATVILLNPSDAPALVRVDVLPGGTAGHGLSSSTRFEALAPRAGVTRLVVAEGGPDRRLRVADDAEATVLTAAGRVLEGRRLALGPTAGVAWLRHGPGLVMAWVEDGEAAGLWSGVAVPEPEAVELPVRLPLDGEVRAFSVELAERAVLSLAHGASAVARLQGAVAERVWVDEAGGTTTCVAGPGAIQLHLRALAGATLGGSLEITTSPITATTEGLGPEVLLAPGGSHGFVFSVTEPGHVGLGVRAEADIVETELLTAGGTSLGRGVVQMHELPAGEYLLMLRAPSDGQPVRCRPAVAGLLRPSTDPPEEVVLQYLGGGR